jgi:hypothetical protein
MKKNGFKLLISCCLVMLTALAVFTSCKKDDNNDGNKVLVEDGFYIKGGATALTDLDIKGMMKVTKNEVLQEDRPGLFELYIAVSNSSEGFNIELVAGSKTKTFGPGSDFALSTEKWENDEPGVNFYRGSYAESTIPFTVASSGLYHVVIDTFLGKAAVMPVHWGIIGGATSNGWGGSTALTESAFDLNTISFSLTNFELRGGDWKFRYSDGWKVDLDTILDLGSGKKGVKVNTNFGGTIDALVAGGDNIVNANPGLYDLTLVWTLGVGTKATLTKKGDLPLTNWADVVLDAVGDGISADNTSATDDISSWNWGNVIIADNAGIPSKVGDVYTWIWTGVVLEADQGFKIRTLNGNTPSNGNGANFDVGFSAVEVAASSSKVVDNSGNLSVNAKGTFNMKIVIDAADADSKTITITE